jgi:tetratricopeptide (TPR) repeat protein
MSIAQNLYEQAQIHFKEGEYADALQHLWKCFSTDNQYVDAYSLAAKILDEIGGEEEARLFQACAEQFGDANAFYDLGYHFVDAAQWEVATPFLERAFALNPTDLNMAYELSLALTARFQFERATEIIESVEFRNDFWLSYRLYFCNILQNREVNIAQQFVRSIREQIYLLPQRTDDETFALQKLTELQEMIRRLESLYKTEPFEEGKKFIRNIHFLQYGGAILDFMEEENGGREVAGGRYVGIWFTKEIIANILAKLVLFLAKMEKQPSEILYVLDRDAEILAKVLAKKANIPANFLSQKNIHTKNALIIAKDAKDFHEFLQLVPLENEQITFALQLNWLESAAFCPDIVGVMAQYANPYWNGGRVVQNNQSFQIEADMRKTDMIAAEILEVAPAIDAYFESHLAFYEAQKSFLKCVQKNGVRSHFTSDSPLGGRFS